MALTQHAFGAATPDLIYVIDGPTGSVVTIITTTGAGSIEQLCLTPDGTRGFASDLSQPDIIAFDPVTNTFTTLIAYPISSGNPDAVPIACTNDYVYVTIQQSPSVSGLVVCDAVANTYIKTILATANFSSNSEIATSPDQAWVVISSVADSVVYIVATSTNTLAGSVTVNAGTGLPRGVAITPDSSTAYVVDEGFAKLYVIDILTQTLTTTITLPYSTNDFISISQDGQYVLVPHRTSEAFSVVSVATNTVLNTYTTGAGSEPFFPANPQNDPNHSYIADTGSTPQFYVIDTTGTLTNTVPITGVTTAESCAVSPDGTYYFVANPGTDSVACISTPITQTGNPSTSPSAVTFLITALAPTTTPLQIVMLT